MSKELIFTSAPRGLVPGSNGYCTVAMSEGLPNSWRERLESLSSYTRHYSPDDPRNPVAYSHLQVNGRHVLSRISEAGKEHTGRTNHLAHHVVLEDGELALGGPAWLLSQPGFLLESWSGMARWLEPSRLAPSGDAPPRVCRSWHKLTGDAGWAGVLAEGFLDFPERSAVLLYEGGQQVLPLFAEALALLPPERRWEVTFSTYFTGVLPGLTCCWRGVLRGTEEAKELRRRSDLLVVEISPTRLVQDGPLIELARTGRRVGGAAVKQNVAARPARLRPAPRADAPAWQRPQSPVAADPFDSMPPPPPMPPVPRKFQAESAGWRVHPLVLVLLLLFAAAAGGGGFWLSQRRGAPPPDEPRAVASARNTETDWGGKIGDLRSEIKELKEQFDKVKGDLKKPSPTNAEEQPEEDRYEWLWIWPQIRDRLPKKASKAGGQAKIVEEQPKEDRYEWLWIWPQIRDRLPKKASEGDMPADEHRGAIQGEGNKDAERNGQWWRGWFQGLGDPK